MGEKSNGMNRDVARAMQELKKECRALAVLFGNFCDETAPEFLKSANYKPVGGILPKDYIHRLSAQYGVVKEMAGMIEAKIEDCSKLLMAADAPLVIFEKFLKQKAADHKNDWTNLKKMSLQKHTVFVAQARAELANLMQQCINTKISLQDQLVECDRSWRKAGS